MKYKQVDNSSKITFFTNATDHLSHCWHKSLTATIGLYIRSNLTQPLVISLDFMRIYLDEI